MENLVDILYCLMESAVDITEMINKGIYKRLYGDEWEARLRETLIVSVRQQLRSLGASFWVVITFTSWVVTMFSLHKRCGDILAMIISVVVALIIALPFYLWWRKHYDELIANHEYVDGRPRYKKYQKIAVLIGYLIWLTIPLDAFVVCAFLTN